VRGKGQTCGPASRAAVRGRSGRSGFRFALPPAVLFAKGFCTATGERPSLRFDGKAVANLPCPFPGKGAFDEGDIPFCADDQDGGGTRAVAGHPDKRGGEETFHFQPDAGVRQLLVRGRFLIRQQFKEEGGVRIPKAGRQAFPSFDHLGPGGVQKSVAEPVDSGFDGGNFVVLVGVVPQFPGSADQQIEARVGCALF